MLELTKRQFIRLAGLSLAERIFPHSLWADPLPLSQNKELSL
jgi:hypothetical protein